MGYRILGQREGKFGPRKGLEGPFYYPSGMVLYYDPKAGEYWDPTTDFYVSPDIVNDAKREIFEVLSR
jgi:hypothetical protein